MEFLTLLPISGNRFIAKQVGEPINIEDLADFMSDLKDMARQLLYDESDAHSVRPTDLVLSALRRNKLVGQEWENLTWKNRAYFFGAMKHAMMRALIDRARKKAARPKLTFTDLHELPLGGLAAAVEDQPEYVVALGEALAWLEQHDPALADLVSDRFLVGLSVKEMAALHRTSERTVRRKWEHARLMLYDRIKSLLKNES